MGEAQRGFPDDVDIVHDVRVALVDVLFLQQGGETFNFPQQPLQIVGDRIGEGFEFFGFMGQCRGAFAQARDYRG